MYLRYSFVYIDFKNKLKKMVREKMIGKMTNLQEVLFAFERILNRFGSVDVQLTTVNNADNPQFDGNHATSQYVHRVRS